MNLSKNKKAQGMSTNTIILLILGVIVLVVLILGFTSGWNVFKNIASPTNVENVVDECATSCGLNQKFSFCTAERVLRVNEEKIKMKTSCAVLSELPELKRYDIEPCPGIQCELDCEEIKINDKYGSMDLTEGYNVSSLIAEGNCFVAK